MDRHDEQAERALDQALSALPRHTAPAALKQRLADRYLRSTPAPRRRRLLAMMMPAAAMAAVLLVGIPLYYERVVIPRRELGAGLVQEAVTDHLRVLAREHPLDVESGNMHQVKPWFTGRLDFAPALSFLGDADYPLQGGAVGYFLDRKAATLVFKRRLHTISLFVFPADGLQWPAGTHAAALRGFSVLLWRQGGLGYALVSDLNPHELSDLGRRIAGP